MNKLKKISVLAGFLTSATVLLLVTAEIMLRNQGCVPGRLNALVDFVDSDSLTLNPCYTVDSNGIMKFSAFAESCLNYGVYKSRIQNSLYLSDSVKQIYKTDLIGAFADSKVSPEFIAWSDSINRLKTEDSALQLVKYYTLHPINPDGFRSIPFFPKLHSVKKVLLVGDSFTYGFSADPITQSFYDQLLKNGDALIYNTGITCTDPIQYLQVIKTYMPVIEPDIVIVSFYMGNDVMFHYREPLPFQFAAYPIDNKFVTSNPFGRYLSPTDANKVMRISNTLPNQRSSTINNFLAKTVLGTRLWITLSKTGLLNTFDSELEKYQDHRLDDDNPTTITRTAINNILKTVNANHAKIIFVVIPDQAVTNPWNQQFKLNELFKGIPVITAPDSSTWYNPYPDGHFNNYGHSMYATWLLKMIRTSN